MSVKNYILSKQFAKNFISINGRDFVENFHGKKIDLTGRKVTLCEYISYKWIGPSPSRDIEDYIGKPLRQDLKLVWFVDNRSQVAMIPKGYIPVSSEPLEPRAHSSGYSHRLWYATSERDVGLTFGQARRRMEEIREELRTNSNINGIRVVY